MFNKMKKKKQRGLYKFSVVVTGWGTTEENGPQSAVLQKLEMRNRVADIV